MKIGMIGIGLMGHGIARNIIKNDAYTLTFLAHSGNQPTAEIEQMGARAAQTIKETISDADVILLCVTGTAQVQEILFGSDGIAVHAKPGQIIVDCSTSLPEKSCEFAEKLAEKNLTFMDAAMTRTPKEAAEGRLNLILGGAAETCEQLHDLFSQFAEHITHAGPVGTGQAMKLIHNYVSLGYAAIMAEAAAKAAQQGIDAQKFMHVLNIGGGQSVVLERFRPFLSDKDISGLQFSVSNAAKDIGYYIQANGDSPVNSAILDLFCQGVEKLGPEKSVLHLSEMLASPSQ